MRSRRRSCPRVAKPLRMADAARISAVVGCEPGFARPGRPRDPGDRGPRGGRGPPTSSAARTSADAHLTGVNWGRDLPEPAVADLRNVVDGDPSPDGARAGCRSPAASKSVTYSSSGSKYSEAMGATVQDEQGRDVVMPMGCYGIGVTRIVAAAIEQNHDERGIIWPAPLAPFDVVLVGLNWEKSARVRETRARALPRTRRRGRRGAARRPRRAARREVRRRGTVRHSASDRRVGARHRRGQARVSAPARRAQRGVPDGERALEFVRGGSPPGEAGRDAARCALSLSRSRCSPRLTPVARADGQQDPGLREVIAAAITASPASTASTTTSSGSR